MTFLEIANRVTGFSIPVFGVSWNPPKLETKIAEDVITFFEDRRVLFNPFELEVPEYCKQSVIQTREFLTQQLYDVKRGSDLDNKWRAMRSACRKFLDTLSEHEAYFRESNGRLESNIGMGGQMLFYSAMGELRGNLGVLIIHLLIMYGIDCEGDLMNVLPLTKPDDWCAQQLACCYGEATNRPSAMCRHPQQFRLDETTFCYKSYLQQ